MSPDFAFFSCCSVSPQTTPLSASSCPSLSSAKGFHLCLAHIIEDKHLGGARELPLKDGVCGHSVSAPGGLPAGVLRGDEEDVEEVGDDHHGAIEGQLLFPLDVLCRP